MDKSNINTLILVGAILMGLYMLQGRQQNPPVPVDPTQESDEGWLDDVKVEESVAAPTPPIDFKQEIPRDEPKFQRLLPKVVPAVEKHAVTPLILEEVKQVTETRVKKGQTICLIEVSPKDFPCDRCVQAVDMLRAGLRGTNWKIGYDDTCDFKIVESEQEGWPRFRYFKDGVECGLIEGFHGMPEEIKAIVIKHPACNSAYEEKKKRPVQTTVSMKESDYVPPAPPSELDPAKADEILEELRKTNKRLDLLEDDTAYSKPVTSGSKATTCGGGYKFDGGDSPEFVIDCGSYRVTKGGYHGGIYYGVGERWRFNSTTSTVAAYTMPVYTYSAGGCGGGGGGVNPYSYSYTPGWGAGVSLGGFGAGFGGGGGHCVNGMCYR